MTLEKLNTEHFSDVELAAESIAKDVREMKANIARAKTLAAANWVGEGRAGFNALAVAVEWQIKDIADEFWKLYEKLIEIEGAFMEADQQLGTEFETALRESQG